MGQRLALSQEEDRLPLTYVDDAADVLTAPYVILGATGFGLYQLFDSQAGAFPAFFDWIILDEASQMLMPQALLSLVYGKGQYIFCGDVQQLPPVVLGPQPAQERAKTPCADAVAPATLPAQPILAHLLTTYGPLARVRLNTTYRLNQELCELPSQLWYQGDLHPAVANAARHWRYRSYSSLIWSMRYWPHSIRSRWYWPTIPPTRSNRRWKSRSSQNWRPVCSWTTA